MSHDVLREGTRVCKKYLWMVIRSALPSHGLRVVSVGLGVHSPYPFYLLRLVPPTSLPPFNSTRPITALSTFTSSLLASPLSAALR